MNTVREMELALVNAQIDEELANPLFATRTHGTPSCYMAGCKGPMCRAANTNMSRARKGIVVEQDHIDLEVATRTGVHQGERAERLAHQRRGIS